MNGTLSANVKTLRVHNGLSQSELARRARVSRTQITELESGRRRMSEAAVDRVASALDVAPGDLRLSSFSTHQYIWFVYSRPVVRLPWWRRLLGWLLDDGGWA